MVIQGTQIPMYTYTLFLYFSNFQILFLFLYEKKINQNWKENKQKQIKQSNA